MWQHMQFVQHDNSAVTSYTRSLKEAAILFLVSAYLTLHACQQLINLLYDLTCPWVIAVCIAVTMFPTLCSMFHACDLGNQSPTKLKHVHFIVLRLSNIFTEMSGEHFMFTDLTFRFTYAGCPRSEHGEYCLLFVFLFIVLATWRYMPFL